MSRKDDAIRDPELTALLRRNLESAPDAWVHDALSIPSRMALRADAGTTDPWLVVFAPHLGALILIAGLVVALLDPALRSTLVVPLFHPQDPSFWTVAGLLTPLILLLCDQGARGFPVLRRFKH